MTWHTLMKTSSFHGDINGSDSYLTGTVCLFFYLGWVELTQGLQLSQNDSHCDQKFISRYFQITYPLHSCFKIVFRCVMGQTIDHSQRLNFRVFNSGCSSLIICILTKSTYQIIFFFLLGGNSYTSNLLGPFHPVLLCTAPTVISQSLTFHLWQ